MLGLWDPVQYAIGFGLYAGVPLLLRLALHAHRRVIDIESVELAPLQLRLKVYQCLIHVLHVFKLNVLCFSDL